MKKKVIQINTVNENGSTGRIMQSISKYITTNSEYVSLTAYGYGKSSKNNSYKIGTKVEYSAHNLLSRLFCCQGYFSYFSTKRFVSFLKKEKPDLIHFHNLHGNYLNYKLLVDYINNSNIPVIWTLHDCWAFTGKCTYFDYCNCSKWSSVSGCSNCPILEEYPKSYFFDHTFYDFKRKKKIFNKIEALHIVTPSYWLATLVKRSFLKEYPISVINNGIDLNEFKPTKSRLRENYHLKNKYIILGVASPWSKRKGLSDFVKLSEKIGGQYYIVLIGVEEKDWGLFSSNTLCIKKTDSIKELSEWYSTADLFLNPTYEDNFPTVNLEALACNTPVVTYNTGGAAEMVKENCGIVCEKGRLDKVIIAIEEVISNREKYCNGRDVVKLFCDGSSVYKKYLDLYKKILEG